jgi:hypothetical protein
MRGFPLSSIQHEQFLLLSTVVTILPFEPQLAVGGANLKGSALAHGRDLTGSTAHAYSELS